MSYRDLYQQSKDFKDYVDRYCANRQLTLDTALSHKVVHLVAEKYAHDSRMVDDGK